MPRSSRLLWPEKRDKDKVLGDAVPGWIDRTDAVSWIRIPAGFVPATLTPAEGTLAFAHAEAV